VKVNCAALPTDLLESELFGFECGAFTGAIKQKPGKFELADHGTMFLDEISETSLGLQAKLLHVLRNGQFHRLGGKDDVHVDVRVIAASNRDLERAAAAGEFSDDLFLHLNVISIHVPPLRDRREEIPLLTDYFLEKYSAHYNQPRANISRETGKLLAEYDWPGNVRELENQIKRAVVMGEAAVQKDLATGCSHRSASRVRFMQASRS
jgi:transcriptional regulator with GAF, ATPase, and Fis domain